MSFLGRQRELRLLEAAYTGAASAFVPVYGRRRVGKTELLLHWLRSRRGVYLVGKQAPAEPQLRELLEVAAAVVDEPLLAQVAIRGWKDALETIVARWPGDEKVVIVLDEVQWLVEASPELPSVLQELWDRSWSKSGRVVLVVCGSFVGFMEREVLGRKSPLFGRRTAQIHLQPFGFREARQFHPRWSVADAARAWFVCGGVPQYLRAFDERRSIEQNLCAALLDDFAPLRHEPEFLLREELREVQNYYVILTALASGSAPSRDIARATGIPDRSLPYYLQQLVDLGYVRRSHPLDGKRPVARHVRYVLDDPLLRFWFRFVWPHTSLLARLGPERALADLIRPGLDAWFGSRFEDLCREALPDLYAREHVTRAYEVGSYWSKDVQIDVVGLRDDGRTDLGECKWGAVRSAVAVAEELRSKAGHYPNTRGAALGLRVFSQKRPKSVPGDVLWHDLDDLYA